MQCNVGSGNRHLSTGVLLGNLKGEAHLLGLYERQVKEGSGNGMYLSMGSLRGVPGRRAPF